MKKEVFSRFMVADYLTNDEEIAAYLKAAKEEKDPALMAAAIEDVRQTLLVRRRKKSQSGNDAQ
ncbi:DNA-binding protein [Aeromonas jandaei]